MLLFFEIVQFTLSQLRSGLFLVVYDVLHGNMEAVFKTVAAEVASVKYFRFYYRTEYMPDHFVPDFKLRGFQMITHSHFILSCISLLLLGIFVDDPSGAIRG